MARRWSPEYRAVSAAFRAYGFGKTTADRRPEARVNFRIMRARDGVTITLPIRTYSEANARGFSIAKAGRVKRHRASVGFAVKSAIPRPQETGRFEVLLTRIAPSKLDDDNLASSFKAVRDGIADAIGVDDGSSRYVWNYTQRRGGVREYGIEVRIKWKENGHGRNGEGVGQGSGAQGGGVRSSPGACSNSEGASAREG